MSITDGPSGPERPQHEVLARQAGDIEARIKEVLADFPGRMMLAFEAHKREPDRFTVSHLADQLSLVCVKELERARSLYGRAQELADTAGAFGASARYQRYISNVNIGIQAVYATWEHLVRTAEAEGILTPIDELRLAGNIYDSVKSGTELLNGICRSMLALASGGRTISLSSKEQFERHVTALLNLCDKAIAAIGRARAMAPNDPIVENPASVQEETLRAQIEEILSIREQAVNAEILGFRNQ